eukprot:gb/GECH01001440.1/.p1 GENE.gb/GECH01001440.1/~~gb/GECH01001440.1/.p1  ORF type:complete len:226 (+),score=58.93 gb/GECH01001440.1/:1-678(+)
MIREVESFGRTISIEQDLINGGLGANVWDASLVLCKYFENTSKFPPGFWKKKKVLELGSGTGLCGIVLALLGAEVWLTDKNELLSLIEHNVSLNCEEIRSRIHIQELLWGEPIPKEIENIFFDYIIGSDVVYPVISLWHSLSKSLFDLCSEEHTTVIFSYELRERKDVAFWRYIKGIFQYDMIPQSDLDSFWRCDEIRIFHLSKLANASRPSDDIPDNIIPKREN